MTNDPLTAFMITPAIGYLCPGYTKIAVTCDLIPAAT